MTNRTVKNNRTGVVGCVCVVVVTKRSLRFSTSGRPSLTNDQVRTKTQAKFTRNALKKLRRCREEAMNLAERTKASKSSRANLRRACREKRGRSLDPSKVLKITSDVRKKKKLCTRLRKSRVMNKNETQVFSPARNKKKILFICHLLFRERS